MTFQRNIMTDYKKYKEHQRSILVTTELLKHMVKEISSLNVMMVQKPLH